MLPNGMPGPMPNNQNRMAAVPGTQQSMMRRQMRPPMQGGVPAPMRMDPNNPAALQQARDARSGFVAGSAGISRQMPERPTFGSQMAGLVPMAAMLSPEELEELNKLYGYSALTMR